MRKTEEIPLWSTLLEMGFTYKQLTIRLPLFSRLKNLFGANITPRIKTYKDWLVKDINGMHVEVINVDFWYTQARVNGEIVFDARRFDNNHLFEVLDQHTDTHHNHNDT